MVAKKFVHEKVDSWDVYAMEGPADAVLKYLQTRITAAKSLGYRDVRLDFEHDDDRYGCSTHYTLWGTRDKTVQELEKAKAQRKKDRARKAAKKEESRIAQEAHDRNEYERLKQLYGDDPQRDTNE